ncbi:glycine zipper 2TM domain-containing protein [Parasulfuritortus cantonensis]|uniref:Glycine zipper 2TM domain-containing protein n=1 Tax=Parasulfuritortus cantonensis TaxID=2528202 RepID=A0A4R1BGL6_9PROT|nr:glycine zipper 2TM domain-containing protein [Parasulfuritortus cantonensis]TCJ16339.1 glycine zipper 2TM domain-containing protein [Parasulfuritortus cantonensis]
MKTTQIATSLALILATLPAWAGHYPPPPATDAAPFADTARVVSSVPVYEEYNDPSRECWTEQTGYSYRKDDRSYGGAILGAIVGGVVGNQIGRGGGRTAATAAGAAIGAVTGDNIDNDDRDGRRVPVSEERCRTVDHWSRRVTGYNVVYRYQGNQFSTFLPYDPGPTLKVRVSVSVDERW